MKIKSILKLGTLALLTAALPACSFLDTDPQIIPDDGYYNSEQKLIYGLAGVYGVLNSEALYGNYYSLQIANADDLCYFNNYNNSESRPDRYNHSAGTAAIYDTWSKLYEGIKNANRYIEAVEKTEIDPGKLSVDIGLYIAEARFLRAYYHFLLAQAWGDVPLRVKATTSPNPNDVQMAATPQEQVLKWCADEIEATIPDLYEPIDNTPSRVSQTVAQGILARVYLFMAGESVKQIDGLDKKEMYRRAAYWANEVIASHKHDLNESYEEIFINMIRDQYDTQFHESMWEAEFLGDRTSATDWTNGRIGDLIGLRSQSRTTNYSEWACNYSYGYYNGSYTLWQLYWENDRTADETASATVIDKRLTWNLPGYNYRGMNNQKISYKNKAGETVTRYLQQTQSMFKTPWVYNNNFAMPDIEGLDQTIEDAFDPADLVYDPTVMCAVRNAGKWRRETVYEKQMSAKSLYTTINFPILRYADVLLMYAEAINEYAEAPDDQAKEAIREIRKRAGVKTNESLLGDYRSFRDLVRIGFRGASQVGPDPLGHVRREDAQRRDQPADGEQVPQRQLYELCVGELRQRDGTPHLPPDSDQGAGGEPRAPTEPLMVKRLIAEHTMNTKRITYLAATLALATAAVSCEHEEIYEPLEFSVRLAPTNTYRTGDPVVFNFSGNADFITVWTGDTGHEYKHRNRTKVDIADIESCELEIEISQQYGTLNNLVLFAGNKFAGLNGSDAATDRPVVEAIAANDCADWTKLEFTPNNANKFKTYTYDITRFADRFSWGMHLFYPDPKTTMRTYRINPKITVKFKGHDTQVYNYPDMEFVPFSLASQHADDPYIHNVSGNGNLKFQGRPGANNTANIVFQGFSAGAFPEIDQWAFMQPVALNTISPDTGLNIKGVTDDLPSYSYTYTEPGTYTVTFIVAGGNYQGQSAPAPYEVTFTVIDPIE